MTPSNTDIVPDDPPDLPGTDEEGKRLDRIDPGRVDELTSSWKDEGLSEAARGSLEHLIEDIRTGYDKDAPIVVRIDSGFFDQELFGVLEENQVGYVATGKAY